MKKDLKIKLKLSDIPYKHKRASSVMNSVKNIQNNQQTIMNSFYL